MTDNTVRFPISSDQRWKNQMGPRAVPCLVTERYLQFPERSDWVSDGDHMFVDVMTMTYPDDGGPRVPYKITTLCISKQDLLKAMDHVADKTPVPPRNPPE